MIFNSTRAHNKGVRVSAIDTADLFSAALLKCFRVSAGGTGRILRGLHGDCSSLSASSAEHATGPHSADEADIAHDQMTAMYSFPLYSFTSTLTGPFQFFSEAPNLLWSLE